MLIVSFAHAAGVWPARLPVGHQAIQVPLSLPAFSTFLVTWKIESHSSTPGARGPQAIGSQPHALYIREEGLISILFFNDSINAIRSDHHTRFLDFWNTGEGYRGHICPAICRAPNKLGSRRRGARLNLSKLMAREIKLGLDCWNEDKVHPRTPMSSLYGQELHASTYIDITYLIYDFCRLHHLGDEFDNHQNYILQNLIEGFNSCRVMMESSVAQLGSMWRLCPLNTCTQRWSHFQMKWFLDYGASARQQADLN